MVDDLGKTPSEGSTDVFLHEKSPNLDFHDSVLLSYSFPLSSQPSPSLEYYIDVPIYSPMIYDAPMDLGHENKIFNMLGGNLMIMYP